MQISIKESRGSSKPSIDFLLLHVCDKNDGRANHDKDDPQDHLFSDAVTVEDVIRRSQARL